MARAKNNIGVVRLGLASAVIVSHSVEFTDGSRAHEVLTRVFGTLSLGDVAVAAFFLLSGFLITKSYLASRSAAEYLLRRMLRIYPAYMVAFFVIVFVGGPVLGFDTWSQARRLLLTALELGDPVVDGAHINEPMWTVFYEARFYVLTLLLGSLGAFRHRRVILALTCAALPAAFLVEHGVGVWRFHAIETLPLYGDLFGGLFVTTRLLTLYLVGTSVCLFWPEIERRLTPRVAGVSFVACVALFGVDVGTAGFALATFGAASLFWLALKADLGRFQRINDSWDISYGTYLYGWAISVLIVQEVPGIGSGALAIATLSLAWGCGAASWWGIELRSKDALRGTAFARRVAPPGLAA